MRQLLSPGRALNRHHRQRLLAKRRFYHGRDYDDPELERRRGQNAKTPVPCSCCMCGNPRKYFGERTVQERRLEQRGAFPDPWLAYRNGC